LEEAGTGYRHQPWFAGGSEEIRELRRQEGLGLHIDQQLNRKVRQVVVGGVVDYQACGIAEGKDGG